MLQPVFAQSTATVVYQVEPLQIRSVYKPQIAFELTSMNYLSDSANDQNNQAQAELTLGFKKEGFTFADVSLTAGTFTESHTFYAPVPEAYVGWGSAQSNFVALGIKKQSLSFLDRFYHLGLYESYFTNDFINYRQQGFVGIQGQIQAGVVGLKAGFQPITLKNQSAEVREQDGALTSSNRWARRPPKYVEFIAGQSQKIEYAIRDYNVVDILKNQGHTLSLFLGPDSERPWIQASYAHHPLNEIPLSRETYGSVPDFTGHVLLSPVVTYHDVKSVDVNLDQGILKSTFSYIEDQPANTEPLPSETLQFLNPLKVYGVYFELDFKKYLSRAVSVTAAAADIQGGEIKDIMQNGKESLFTFASQRTIFKKPVTLGLVGETVMLKGRPLTASVQWTYDRVYKGSLVSTKLIHETWKNFYLQGGFDLLGVENEQAAGEPSHFLTQNQANDRFYAGVRYAF